MTYHAIVAHSHFTKPSQVQHHTKHRTLRAAARSLSKGISEAVKPGIAYDTWCGIVTPEGVVLSLRQAQGKMSLNAPIHSPIAAAMRQWAGA